MFEHKTMNTMDIAIKKVELIEWLARLRDENLIQQIEIIKQGSIKELHEQRTPKKLEDLEARLEQSEKAITGGRVHTQQEIENHFNARFNK